jgi:hypothetical protein
MSQQPLLPSHYPPALPECGNHSKLRPSGQARRLSARRPGLGSLAISAINRTEPDPGAHARVRVPENLRGPERANPTVGLNFTDHILKS